MFYIIQNIFNILDKRFLELSVHFPISYSHMIFIIWFPHPEQWLSSQASSLFSGSFEELSNFFFLAIGSFFADCKFLVSLAHLKTFCLCVICLLILSLFPRSFIRRQTQFILQCLFKKTFHILAKKASLCQMEFLCGVLSKSCLPTRGPAKELSGQPH